MRKKKLKTEVDRLERQTLWQILSERITLRIDKIVDRKESIRNHRINSMKI